MKHKVINMLSKENTEMNICGNGDIVMNISDWTHCIEHERQKTHCNEHVKW